MFPNISCVIVGSIGLFLLVGGVWLAMLGGSLFFIFLGLGLMICSVLLLRRRDVALAVYGVILLVTVGWSLWEVGFDWWALSARGSLLIVVGLLLLLPPIARRSLYSKEPTCRGYGRGSGVLAACLAISCTIGVYSMLRSPHDKAGAFSDRQMAAMKDLGNTIPDGEWHAYG